MEYTILKSGITEEKLISYSQFLSASSLGIKHADINKCTPQYIKWQYVDNPIGQVVGSDAYFEGELVAHYATLPVLYNINGKKVKGLLALNLVVHPEHRMKGLFLKIANNTFEEAIKLGYNFVVGVANQNATHGQVNRLGFNLIAPLDVKIGIGTIEPNSRENYLMHSVWNEETLLWRLANPSALYFKNNNKTIVTPTGKHNIYAQLHYQGKPYSSLLKHRNKKTLFKLWIGISQIEKQKGCFFNLPKKLKPVPLNLIFKDLTGNNIKFKKEEVFFELIDFDAY